ncbi:uncharacterized protein LOC111809852 isoform X2 [Cucurbita pepo subsp. pepo]|uniref:uncharacterized protein LOC111809852 isoform X2 n=1 Tax=Cucurbita pepo subsp. pepo TaxID=3664 RepID=UPI000C9D71E2|nr:uncharacterized protein LOC111809852 isoform X2 [Cucurbita pepo subsp. pepo]
MVLIKSNNHWAFLEEIEAPMWFDLTLEGRSNNQNIDDKWFFTHHPVHQSSSHDLKLAFSQLFEERTLNLEISVSSSLNLPNSVSRSRGDFEDKKCKGSCQGFAMDKHIVSEKLSSGSATKLSYTDSKGTSSSNLSLVSDASCLTENSRPNVLVTGSSSEGKEPADSRTSSTIITGLGRQQQCKATEVTSQPLSMSSRLLSDMRRSLRKSCANRQVSRLEVNNCQRQSSGHNSSSSNSSTTCSSLNPGFDAKSITNTSEQHLKSSVGVGNFSRMTQTAMNKSKDSSVFSSTLKIQVKGASSNSRRVSKSYAKPTKLAHLESSKPKILRPKAPLLQQRNLQNTCLKPKKKESLDGIGGCKTVVAGKENAIRRIAVSQKCNGRDPSTFNMVKDQKRTEHKVPQRLGGRSVVSSKQAKKHHPSEGKSLEIGSKRVYFR